MKLTLTTLFVIISCSIFSQVTSETKPKKLKSKTSSPSVKQSKITSENSFITSKNTIKITHYFNYRDTLLNALIQYDKTAIPKYNHDLTENQNIKILLQWASKNESLIKENKRQEIKSLLKDF